MIDGRLRDGKDRGGSVGTDSGGSPECYIKISINLIKTFESNISPVVVDAVWLSPGFVRPRDGTDKIKFFNQFMNNW